MKRAAPLARGAGLRRTGRLARIGARGQRIRAALALARSIVEARDGLSCARCGKAGVPLDLHHLRSRARGGGHTADNLVLLDRQCHDGVTFQTASDWGYWTR